MSEGDKAWLGLAAYIAAYDAWAVITRRETLSTAYYRAVLDPRRRWPTVIFWAILSAHLFRLPPERYDPFRAPIARHRRRSRLG